MKVVFVVRPSLFTVRGGDTVQVESTARELHKTGVEVNIKGADEQIEYSSYSLLHFFNIRHPADMLLHIRKSKLPYVISTIHVDYSRNSERPVKGIKDRVLNLFSIDAQEYIKTIMKSVMGGDRIVSREYIWRGHKRSVKWILEHAALLLPNSENEYRRLLKSYGIEKKYKVIPNGADTGMFHLNGWQKDPDMILCVARIELIKNQLNLIKAMNGTRFRLYLIGDPAPNHQAYYRECKRISQSNIYFIGSLPQEKLVQYYGKAKVHVLPSWFETTGLSSLEALYCGCNIVVTPYGDTQDYFDRKHCFYCDPGSVESIRGVIEKAAATEAATVYIQEMAGKYNWTKAAEKTLEAYQELTINTQQ